MQRSVVPGPITASLLQEINIQEANVPIAALIPALTTLADRLRVRSTESPIDTTTIINEINACVAELNQQLSLQLDEILHASAFQKLESAWRGLQFVVDRTNRRENIKLVVVNVSKEDLADDMRSSPENTKSGFYHILRPRGYDVDSDPVGAVIANYEFGPERSDVELLALIADISAMCHAPFIAAASPRFFGRESWLPLVLPPSLGQLGIDRSNYKEWHSFRDREEARFIGLVIPRILLRPRYAHDLSADSSFTYNESCKDANRHLLWGNAAFALASRIVDSFARWRLCVNIIGPRGGGAVNTTSEWADDSGAQGDVFFRRSEDDHQLSEDGFIPLSNLAADAGPCFYSANAVMRRPELPREQQVEEMVANWLPYTFFIARFAHYVEVLNRELLLGSLPPADLECELKAWIGQYVARDDYQVNGQLLNTSEKRARCPLWKARIKVSDTANNSEWYDYTLMLSPLWKYFGSWFSLTLSGRLEKFKPRTHHQLKPTNPQTEPMVVNKGVTPSEWHDQHGNARELGERIFDAYNAGQTKTSPWRRLLPGDDGQKLLRIVTRIYKDDSEFRRLWDSVKGKAPGKEHISWLLLWRTL